MGKRDNEGKILTGIQSQISSFDQKASILVTVFGIFFAITFIFLQLFFNDKFIAKDIVIKNTYIVFFWLRQRRARHAHRRG